MANSKISFDSVGVLVDVARNTVDVRTRSVTSVMKPPLSRGRGPQTRRSSIRALGGVATMSSTHVKTDSTSRLIASAALRASR